MRQGQTRVCDKRKAGWGWMVRDALRARIDFARRAASFHFSYLKEEMLSASLAQPEARVARDAHYVAVHLQDAAPVDSVAVDVKVDLRPGDAKG